MHKIFEKEIVSSEQILVKNKELGEIISKDYKNSVKPPILIGVMKGCLPFFGDLIKNITIDIEIDYIQASSYNGTTTSSGTLKMIKDISVDIENRDILIVEDIIDTGLTLEKIISNIKSKKPRSLKIVSFLDKPSGRLPGIDIKIDYLGFEVPDEFLVGYGLDYKELYRNIYAIGILKKDRI